MAYSALQLQVQRTLFESVDIFIYSVNASRWWQHITIMADTGAISSCSGAENNVQKPPESDDGTNTFDNDFSDFYAEVTCGYGRDQ